MEGFLATCVRISALPSVVNTHLTIIPLFPLLSRKLSQEREIKFMLKFICGLSQIR